MNKYVPIFGAILLSSAFQCATALANNCNMASKYNHYGTAIYSAKSGIHSLYYSTNMDVNTDGGNAGRRRGGCFT